MCEGCVCVRVCVYVCVCMCACACVCMSLEEPPHTVSIAVPALVLALLVPTLLLGPRLHFVAHAKGRGKKGETAAALNVFRRLLDAYLFKGQ